ncbi:MAG: hypothetical protein ACTSUE_16165, partial [Promethearchaeota archaeon]
MSQEYPDSVNGQTRSKEPDAGTIIIYWILVACWIIFIITIFIIEELIWGVFVSAVSAVGIISLGRMLHVFNPI